MKNIIIYKSAQLHCLQVHKWQRENCAATPPHKTSNLLALAVLFIIVLLIDACPLTYICEQTNEIIESKYNCFLEYLFWVKMMGGEYINVIFSEAESPKLDRLIACLHKSVWFHCIYWEVENTKYIEIPFKKNSI
jgi:hypothetical protein